MKVGEVWENHNSLNGPDELIQLIITGFYYRENYSETIIHTAAYRLYKNDELNRKTRGTNFGDYFRNEFVEYFHKIADSADELND